VRPHWGEAAGWVALLGVYFFLVYGTCNWVTSHRTDVPTFFWEWERLIPFVPLMILPYMSIDLFFVGSPFMCKSRSELHTFAARILFVIGASGICFLLFPLKFAFERPEVAGVLGLLFAPLNAHDLPYNLAPSLHISLRTILLVTFERHLRGPLRTATTVWFSLITISTLMVWQHHLIDVITGFAMGILTLRLLPERADSTSTGVPPRKSESPALSEVRN
jgi:membrane-associated phospholipid phosphatase